VDQWLAYQTLWDTQVSDVAAAVGSDVQKWQALLLEAAEARSTLDSLASISEFGLIVVKYGKVQSQINLKYDSWQKELQTSFAAVLGQCIKESHHTIANAKTKLEATTLDSASTDSIVMGVTFIQEVKQKVGVWAKELDALSASEKQLKGQRFVFNSDWTEISVVKGLYDSLQQILERRTRTMEQQIPILQARISAEDKSSAKQLGALLASWEEEKPLRGSMSRSKRIVSRMSTIRNQSIDNTCKNNSNTKHDGNHIIIMKTFQSSIISMQRMVGHCHHAHEQQQQ